MTIKAQDSWQDSLDVARKISVIIPLEFHRGLAVDCIHGWAKAQNYPREDYQILLGVPAGFDSGEQLQIQQLLQPWDRLVVCEHKHDMTLIEEVARLADTELLLFSESHCLPDPDALSYLIHVANTQWQWSAFSAPTHGMTHNLLSQIECAIYSQDISGKLSSHNWLRVLDQCFVIRHNIYHQVGGFRGEFGHFAEWLFAAALEVHNFSLGVAERAVVSHGYVGDYHDLADFTLDFARGQIRYLDKCRDEPQAALFPSLPELDDFKLRSRETRQRAFQYIDQDSSQTLFVAVRKFLHRESVGPLRPYLKWLTDNRTIATDNLNQLHARAKTQADIARAALEHAINIDHRDAAHTCFVEWFARLVKQGRYDYLAETYAKGDSFVSERPEIFTYTDAWSADNGSSRIRLFHAHDAEGTEAGAIRWTLPTLQILLPLQTGQNYTLVVRWSNIRELHRSELIRVRLNGRELASTAFQFQPTQLRLKMNITQSDWHELVISVYPFQGLGDSRLLGLPLQNIHWFLEPQST